MDNVFQKSLGFVGLACVWEFTARTIDNPVFPPISLVLPRLFQLILDGALTIHVGASIQTILGGFTLAAVLGISLGIATAEFDYLERIVSPLVDAMRPVAALTLFPLLILIFGLGMPARVFVIFWTAWPPILINTIQAIRQVDRDIVEAAQLDGANRWALLRFFKLPLSLPLILTGLRIGMGTGWISLISSEMLGSSRGLGFSILSFSQTFRFLEMYATIILIALLGLTMNSALGWYQHFLSE